jgi:hypothetical protein
MRNRSCFGSNRNLFLFVSRTPSEEVFTEMLTWALEWAKTSQLRITSRNFDNGLSTRDLALRILGQEVDRGYTGTVEEQQRIADSPCCWEEGRVPHGYAEETRRPVMTLS